MEKKYIIYLHPNINTDQYNQLNNLWNDTPNYLTQNSATIYPFHSTLTGFFKTEEPENILAHIDHLFAPDIEYLKCDNIKYVDHGNFKAISYNSDYIVMKIKLLLQNFNYIRSPSLSILHFTLLNNIKEEENDIANNLINKYIDLNIWQQDWVVIMWEIVDDKWSIYYSVNLN